MAVADLPVALDAMGGDRAPDEIIAGALDAVAAGLPVVLVGPVDGSLGDVGGLEIIPASEVITMKDDPAKAVRTKKDSSLLRAAEAVRDGRASAMVSAGNTGATMASALFRMGRLPGVARPCIATPLPVPGGSPTVMVDAGANADCQSDWLVQFAEMGAAFYRERYGVLRPKVALLSIGEESSKGNVLVKETHERLAAGEGAGGAAGLSFDFIGNVEGRDLLTGEADVVVTDGFTGNVALKTLEGALKTFMTLLGGVMSASDEAKAASEVLLPGLLEAAAPLDPEATGGAMLLGVDGVCIISHGSSTRRAIVNAIRAGHDLAARGIVGTLAEAVRPPA
ncbi:MAG: phosphate acyltransferase PlsX [Acidimicrobiales bacterium]